MHPALHYLGISFNCGLGTPKDVEKAFDYFLKAAEQGLPDAQAAVAGFLMEATVGVKEPARGLEFLKLAVAQNSPEAIAKLAVLYARGIHVEQDWAKAGELFTRAAELGAPDAQYNLANLYFNGQVIEQSFEQFVFWLKKAARQKHKPALAQLQTISSKAEDYYNAGIQHLQGGSIECDDGEAVKLFWLASLGEGGWANVA
jgi:uncharacterized protein